MPARSVVVAAIAVSVFFLVQCLWYSQSILIPFIFAILIWNLLCTISRFFQKLPLFGNLIPYPIAILLSLLTVGMICLLLGKIISGSMSDMLVSSASLQQKTAALLDKLVAEGYSKAYLADALKSVLKELNVQGFISGFYSVISNLMSSLFLMLLFVIFFFIESSYFQEKLGRVFEKSSDRKKVAYLLKEIPAQIQFYLGMKSLFSGITAVGIYIVMKIMDFEFAEFWAVCIFFMNFIPNIGAILVTVVMTLFAYFQWLDLAKVGIFFTAQLFIHALIGNVVETHYLGKTMNLSPMVLLLSLCFWGMIWGGTGLFLAVPMTVLMMIILASFPSTRVYALLMSEKGELPEIKDDIND
jgi:AI-2 transport protein TqsA